MSEQGYYVRSKKVDSIKSSVSPTEVPRFTLSEFGKPAFLGFVVFIRFDVFRKKTYLEGGCTLYKVPILSES